MEENITAFELIQDRLEEVTESDALVNEEADTMAQRKTHSDLVEAYQGLIRAGQAWITGERLKDKVTDLVGRENLSGNYAWFAYEQLVADFKDFRQDIKRIPDRVELCVVKDFLGPALEDLHNRMDKELTDVTTTDSSVSSELSDKITHISIARRSRLKLELRETYSSGETSGLFSSP